MWTRLTVQQIISNGLVAGLYIILTVIPPLNQISFLTIQFRIAEVLLLLVFFRKDYAIGLVIGTSFANLFAPHPLAIYDAILGAIVTAIACWGIGRSKNYVMAMIYPIVLNAIYLGVFLQIAVAIPSTLSIVAFFSIATAIALGEGLVLFLLGYPLYLTFRKNKQFLILIGATQNVR
jgi:uncharacterized membrane protein